jgi:biotin synthase
MGETRASRASLIAELANLPPPGIGADQRLVPVPGTPLANAEPIDAFEFVRTIAVARITMPASCACRPDARR